ncbi:MAG TPA: GNAT family N-acetyltransferase [Mycobacteriales bacterium]|nr:GNAT family N-acetyltransferase [Mycobacteriales bacterium]
MSIRPATAADVPVIADLIRDLAAYERAADEVRITEADLARHLFGENPVAFAHVAISSNEILAGFSLAFLTFSTWLGRPGIYLEDLFVRPECRGQGLGRGLMRALARTAVKRGYGRLDWAALDWNTPAIDFYRELGAVPLEEWTTFRLTGPALVALAEDPAPGKPPPPV